MKVIDYDLFQNKEASKQMGFSYIPLDKLFAKADIISIHVPRTPETKGLIDIYNCLPVIVFYYFDLINADCYLFSILGSQIY